MKTAALRTFAIGVGVVLLTSAYTRIHSASVMSDAAKAFLTSLTPQQRERFLIPAINGERRDCFAVTEEKAGSDPSLIETVAERDGDGYRISGEKWFVTVGDVADFLIVQALVGPERAPTLFLVDKSSSGVSVKRTPAYMHTFVFEHPEFIFDSVAVGADQVLGEIGGGYDLTREWFVEERLMIAARATRPSP